MDASRARQYPALLLIFASLGAFGCGGDAADVDPEPTTKEKQTLPEGEGETSNGATTTQTDGGTTADASTTPKPQTDAGSSTSGLAFMAKCTNVGSPGGCASGLQCYNFNSRGKYCTKSCTQTSDCAAPSTGCNGMGVCKAP